MAPDGGLMEGLTSNFFALQHGKLVTAEEGVLSGTVRELVLQVRGAWRLWDLGCGGVVGELGAQRLASSRTLGSLPRVDPAHQGLPGLRGPLSTCPAARHRAQVAEELGVPVELRAPSISELGSFEAAFISSTSRLLLPVHELDAPDLQPPARRVLPPSELAQRLEAAVAAEIAACSEPVA